MIDLTGKKIIISRTDSIGDVMLTLPICAWLKDNFKDLSIVFLGKGYTRSVVTAYEIVDEFLDWAELENKTKQEQAKELERMHADAIIHVFPRKEIAKAAKTANIPVRVGTSHRLFHRFTCTHKLNFTRKRSTLHEAQLNHELLKPFGLRSIPSLQEISSRTSYFKPEAVELPAPFDAVKNYVILHPKSQGSAREWPIQKYMELAERLTQNGKNVVFTGTEKEGDLFRNAIPDNSKILDSTGKLSLEQLMILIRNADALVACSTGPLHIAGYLNINTIGLFSPKRPIHPGRWKALGNNVSILVNDDNCETCAAGKDCNCIEEISVDRVLETIK